MSGLAATRPRRDRARRRRDRSRAVADSFRKLDPRAMVANPVMFVVEVGAVLHALPDRARRPRRACCSGPASPSGSGARSFSRTSPRRWPRAAARRRRPTCGRRARTRPRAGSAPAARPSRCRAPRSQLDDLVVVAGETIPCDGEVVEGVATVDESAITGESAPVIRESGGDRSAVTGGTRVLGDRIVVRVTARAGETFLDRMIALVEGAERQRTPERDRALDPARRADDRLPARDRHACSRSPIYSRRRPGRRPCSSRCWSA